LTAQYKKTPLALLGHHVTHLSRQAQKQVCVSLSSHLSLRQESFSACECLREGLEYNH